MFTLIKREIEDNAIVFIIGLAITLFLVCWLATTVAMEASKLMPIGLNQSMYFAPASLMFIASFMANTLGAAQMFKDRDQKISAFLLTLATTRNKIFSARIIAGLIWIFMMIIPIAIAELILVQIFPVLIPYPKGMILKLFVIMFLILLCFYSTGLVIGDSKRKNFSQIMGMIITAIILSLIIIKGFGIDTALILIILTVALLGKVWQNFSSAAL